MSAIAEFALFAAEDCPLCGQVGSMIVPGVGGEEPDAGAGADTSERMCLDCGLALFVDPAAGPAVRTA